jgi:hypothetical protein
MTTTLESAVEFDIYTDEPSIRLAAQRIRTGIGRLELSRPTWGTPTDDERRSEPRHPLVAGAFLMPVEMAGERARQLDADEPLVPVITLNMSPRGVGIQHQEPVPEKTCLLIFDLWAEDPVALLVKHRWFRQESESGFRYRSGFAIIGVASERRPQSGRDE